MASDNPGLLKNVDMEGYFPDIDDVEGYVEQESYYDSTKIERTYFYRLGNSVSSTFVPCADVDCEGVYYIRDIIARAYQGRQRHLVEDLPCCVCRDHGRRGSWCKARFSIDIKYKQPRQEPREGPSVPSPDERYDLY